MNDTEVLVIGGGQAGLAAAYHLVVRGSEPGVEVVVLDGNDGPGGAWRHRWPSLRLGGVHGIHPLPGTTFEGDDDRPAREVVPTYFADYERRFALPVERPVSVTAVREAGDAQRRLLVDTSRGVWRTRALINATGTWTRPFRPVYPGAASFRGRQLHTVDYDDAREFEGQHVVVVGGGHSAVQLLAEISKVTSTTWVTRRPPVWRDTFDRSAGREAVQLVADAVREGRRPASVVSVTGLAPTPPVEQARRNGALERRPMFARIVPDGVVWEGGDLQRADVILWATGFRHALDHLAPLGLRGPRGGIRMDGTQVADEPRVHLLGYGPSASTIGAERAARIAVREIRTGLGRR